MDTLIDKDRMLLSISQVIAKRSSDPITKVGALISTDDDCLVDGWNELSAFNDQPERWKTSVKHDRVIHAEVMAIGRAAREGVPTGSCTMYCTLFPCLNCALVMIAAGVCRVVAQKAHYAANDKRFLGPLKRFEECGVEVCIIEWPEDAKI